jgi:hypothetical protein
LKENNCQPRLLHPEILSFRFKGEVKTFQDKQNLKQLITTKPIFQKILKGILQTEQEDIHNAEKE